MTDFKVGNRVKITKDFPSATHRWLKGDLAVIRSYGHSRDMFCLEADDGRKETFHSDHLELVPGSAPTGPRKLECPYCQAHDSFYEVNRSTNTSDIYFVDADTGEIGWTGDTNYGDPTEVVGYECGNCQTEIEDWYFDPAKRAAHDEEAIRAAQESLDAILSS